MRPKTTEIFILEARTVHGDRYDYSKTCYKSGQDKVVITCKIHGDFEQFPFVHLKGSNCRECHFDKKRKTTKQFVRDARRVHGKKYDYSKVKYFNAYQKITIICPEHGEFDQVPHTHLDKRSGCPLCKHDKLCKTTEQFIADAQEKHGDQYDYSKSVYVNGQTELTIICPEHGEFEMTPNRHLSKYGYCLKCRDFAMNTEKFIQRAIKIHGDRYDYSEVVYLRPKIPVIIKCKKHGGFNKNPIITYMEKAAQYAKFPEEKKRYVSG